MWMMEYSHLKHVDDGVCVGDEVAAATPALFLPLPLLLESRCRGRGRQFPISNERDCSISEEYFWKLLDMLRMWCGVM